MCEPNPDPIPHYTDEEWIAMGLTPEQLRNIDAGFRDGDRAGRRLAALFSPDWCADLNAEPAPAFDPAFIPEFAPELSPVPEPEA